MNITLKNIKHSAFASQETHCYSAVLYVNNKKFATVSNEGFGGCDRVEPINGGFTPEFLATLKAVSAHIKTICKEEYASLEYWCALEVNDFLMRKDLRNGLKNKVLGIGADGKVYSWKKISGVTLDGVITAVKAVRPDTVILNEMSEDDAFRLFKQAVAA